MAAVACLDFVVGMFAQAESCWGVWEAHLLTCPSPPVVQDLGTAAQCICPVWWWLARDDYSGTSYAIIATFLKQILIAVLWELYPLPL